jgi:hypothetical protein
LKKITKLKFENGGYWQVFQVKLIDLSEILVKNKILSG